MNLSKLNVEKDMTGLGPRVYIKTCESKRGSWLTVGSFNGYTSTLGTFPFNAWAQLRCLCSIASLVPLWMRTAHTVPPAKNRFTVKSSSSGTAKKELYRKKELPSIQIWSLVRWRSFMIFRRLAAFPPGFCRPALLHLLPQAARRLQKVAELAMAKHAETKGDRPIRWAEKSHKTTRVIGCFEKSRNMTFQTCLCSWVNYCPYFLLSHTEVLLTNCSSRA